MRAETLPVLYSFRRCPYAMRARLAVQVCGTVCELREVVLRDKPQCMLDASAKGTVPVLVHGDGEVLDESMEIMLWALQKSDPQGWLVPDYEPMMALISQTDGDFKYHLDRYKYPNRYGDTEPLIHRAAGARHLRLLEERLTDTRYLSGDQPSLADMAVAPFVRQYAMTDRIWFNAQNWSLLCAWLDRIVSSEAFVTIMVKYPQWHAGDSITRFPT